MTQPKPKRVFTKANPTNVDLVDEGANLKVLVYKRKEGNSEMKNEKNKESAELVDIDVSKASGEEPKTEAIEQSNEIVETLEKSEESESNDEASENKEASAEESAELAKSEGEGDKETEAAEKAVDVDAIAKTLEEKVLDAIAGKLVKGKRMTAKREEKLRNLLSEFATLADDLAPADEEVVEEVTKSADSNEDDSKSDPVVSLLEKLQKSVDELSAKNASQAERIETIEKSRGASAAAPDETTVEEEVKKSREDSPFGGEFDGFFNSLK